MKRNVWVAFWGLLLVGGCAKEDPAGLPVREPQPEERPATDEASSAEGTFRGRIRVKFKPSQREIVPMATKSGGIATGVAAVDEKVLALKATFMKRVFPPAGRFEERTRREGLHLWYDIRFDEEIPVSKAVSDLGGLAEIEVAEPIFKTRSLGGSSSVVYKTRAVGDASADAPFDDPFLADQWHYNNTGVLPNSVPGADIGLFEAWKRVQGSREVIVAVVDGGIDYEHEDLKGNVGNPAELYGLPGVDDDGNGYVDDLYGWNFVKDCNEIEIDSHGTHVAGTIGAENGNGVGVCGVAGGHGNHSGVWLLSCQTFGTENGEEVSSDSPATVKYGADAGAVISQNSWGYVSASFMPQSMREAIDYFIKYAGTDETGAQSGPMKGGIVIFAAGNDDRDDLWYPAAYEPVLSVSAFAPDYRKSYYSNYADWVDIAAPGGTYAYDGRYSDECAVLSTLPGNRYGYMQGTSMACPHVSGIAALVVSELGGPGFTPEKLRAHLMGGTRDLYAYNPEYGDKLGIGCADARMALSEDGGIAPDAVTDIRCGNTAGAVEVSWDVTADGDDGTAFRYFVYWSTSSLEGFDPDRLSPEVSSAVVPVSRGKRVGDELSCTISGIRGETRYWLAVVAADVWGNRSVPAYADFVSAYNRPPVITGAGSEKIVLGYNESREVTLSVSDPEGYACTYVLDDPSQLASSRMEEDRIVLNVRNYKHAPGEYPLRVEVTDLGGATASVELRFELEANRAPVLTTPFEDVYFGSLLEVRDISLGARFRDEGPDEPSYSFDYDRNMVYVRQKGDRFELRPLRYGLSRVSVTARDGEGLECSDTFEVMARDYTQEVDLYPNPVHDVLHVRMGSDAEGVLSLTILDVSGRKVFGAKSDIAPFAPASFDLSRLGSGSYTAVIGYGGREITRTVVKL